MKIGIFDSGIGGLLVTHSLIRKLPQYDYLYLGDTARVPYGNRSQATVFQFTQEAVDYLFRQGCGLVIVACNTASAEALRRLQQEWMSDTYPDRRLIGVMVPAAEAAAEATKNNRIGILATASTVNSGAFPREIRKVKPEAIIVQQAAPLLVPLIEFGGLQWVEPILCEYLQPLIDQDIDCLVLGCTHYPMVKKQIRKIVGPEVAVISQDECVAERLSSYLERHPEISHNLSQDSGRQFQTTDPTEGITSLAANLFGSPIIIETASLLQTIGN